MIHTKALQSAFVWFITLTGLIGCASTSRNLQQTPEPTPSLDRFGGTATAPAHTIPDRIYAIPGEALVIPVGSPFSITQPLSLSDGTTLPTRLFLVTRTLKPLDPLAWLDPAGGWDAKEHTLGQPVTNEAGLWMVLVEFPETSSTGPILLGERRLPVMWLPAPPAATDSRFLPRLNASASAWRELGDIITPLRNDPAQRWRVRLFTDRVRPDRLFGAGGADFIEKPIENDLLEALARQTELRYRAAIARIQLADSRAAADLLAVLTTVVAMPDGQLLPTWADITPRLSSIVDTAINTARPPARAAEATRSFIDALSPIRSWIIDDASTGQSDFRATVGITNLSNSPVTTASGAANQAFTTRAIVDAHRTETVRAAVVIDPPRTPIESPRARPVVVRIDEPHASHPIFTPGLDFDPPGPTLTPALLPWTRRTWLSQSPFAAPVSRQTAVLIQESPAAEGWELYIECNSPKNAIENPPTNDLVRIWLGPHGRSKGYLVCGPGATTRLTGAEAPEFKLHTWGWSSVVPIPERVIDEQGIVHIAVERIDEGGFRSTWPRPVLPDQLEPGRATFKLVAWDGTLTSNR